MLFSLCLCVPGYLCHCAIDLGGPGGRGAVGVENPLPREGERERELTYMQNHHHGKEAGKSTMSTA